MDNSTAILTMTAERVYHSNPKLEAAMLLQSSLLKKATSLKKEKNYDEAIEALREAFTVGLKHEIGNPIKEFTRIGNYLILANRIPEAWDEYHRAAECYWCPWYKLNPHSYASMRAEALGRISGMLFGLDFPIQALAYRLASSLMYLTVLWINDDNEKKQHTSNIKGWSKSEALNEDMELLIDPEMKSQRKTIIQIFIQYAIQIPKANPYSLRDDIYRLFGCKDPEIHATVQKGKYTLPTKS